MTEPKPGAPAIIRYAEYSLEEFEGDVNKAKSISGGSFMELQQGDNVVRFVPSSEPGRSPIRSTGMHYLEALPGIDKKVIFACPKKEGNLPCPVCEKVAEMRRSPNPLDRDAADTMSVKLQLFANVIDRSAPADDPTHGLRVLRFGKTILEQLKTIRRNERVGGDFFVPTPQGFDVVIVKEGSGKNDTRYKVIPDRHPSPIHPDPDMAQLLIDNAHDLEALINPVVPEEVLVALQSTRAAYGIGMAGRAPAGAAQLPAAPRASWGQAPAQATQAPAVPAQRPGAGLFAQPPRGGQAVADADFTDDDDFGPPPKGSQA